MDEEILNRLRISTGEGAVRSLELLEHEDVAEAMMFAVESLIQLNDVLNARHILPETKAICLFGLITAMALETGP